MSSDSTVLVSRLGRLAKSILPIDPIRNYVRTTSQRSLLERALDELTCDPWRALDVDSDIPRRLIEGWGNASWSTDDEYLIASIDELGRTEGPILECGSGLSTIVLGIIARQMGREVWTLEHNAHWGERVGEALGRRGLSSVRLCVNPLKDYGEFSWYDPPLADMPRTFGIVICDGPPGHGHGGRSGFLPVMRDRLAPHCTILLDDTTRGTEKAIAERWSGELNATVEFCGRRKSFAAIRVGQAMAAIPTLNCATPPVVTIGLAAEDSVDAAMAPIESMRGQTFADWSLLVSGAAAGETTRRCVLLAQADPRIHCHPRARARSRAEIHNGLSRKSRSAYFKWLRPGERWDDGTLAACLAALEADDDAVLACPVSRIANATPTAAAAATGVALPSRDPVQRFRELLSTVRSADALYGLIRTEVLRDTALWLDARGAGLVLLAELALRGKFLVVSAGIGAQLDVGTPGRRPGEQRDDILPVGAGDALSHLRGAVWRSPLGIGSKLACLRFLSAHATQLRQSVARLDGEPV